MFRYKCYRSAAFYINKCLLLRLMYLQQSNAGTAKCYPPQQLFSQWVWTSPAGTQLSAQRTTQLAVHIFCHSWWATSRAKPVASSRGSPENRCEAYATTESSELPLPIRFKPNHCKSHKKVMVKFLRFLLLYIESSGVCLKDILAHL